MDIFIPIWIVFGVIFFFVATGIFIHTIDKYRLEKNSRYANKKVVARRANDVLKAAVALLLVPIWPIAAIPAVLYFPVKGAKSSFKFFRQVFADRKGE
jgi:hypothetical protein